MAWSVLWRQGNINTAVTVLQSLCTILKVHNDTSSSMLQVGRMDRALILLSLALYLPTACVSSVFMVLYIYLIFLLHSSL